LPVGKLVVIQKKHLSKLGQPEQLHNRQQLRLEQQVFLELSHLGHQLLLQLHQHLQTYLQLRISLEQT
jgi:hypothetical protein